jgi:hypothetical protein
VPHDPRCEPFEVAAWTGNPRQPSPRGFRPAGILSGGEVAEWLMAALLKSAESKDFVGSNPTLSATAWGWLRNTPPSSFVARLSSDATPAP